MSTRTTIELDADTLAAEREPARRHASSVPEPVRRVVLRHRDAVLRVPAARCAARRRILARLFERFRGHDPERELRRLESEDAGF